VPFGEEFLFHLHHYCCFVLFNKFFIVVVFISYGSRAPLRLSLSGPRVQGGQCATTGKFTKFRLDAVSKIFPGRSQNLVHWSDLGGAELAEGVPGINLAVTLKPHTRRHVGARGKDK
jgi:hypothetical protein